MHTHNCTKTYNFTLAQLNGGGPKIKLQLPCFAQSKHLFRSCKEAQLLPDHERTFMGLGAFIFPS